MNRQRRRAAERQAGKLEITLEELRGLDVLIMADQVVQSGRDPITIMATVKGREYLNTLVVGYRWESSSKFLDGWFKLLGHGNIISTPDLERAYRTLATRDYDWCAMAQALAMEVTHMGGAVRVDVVGVNGAAHHTRH